MVFDKKCPMEYKRIVQTDVEMSGYLRVAESLFTETEREQIVAMVSADPEYILRSNAFPIFLVAAYAKNEKDNLTKKERNELAKRADEIFAKYRR